MRKYMCDICHDEILRWHSYHDTGYSLAHMACEVGRRPPREPRAVYRESDKSWFDSDEKEQAARHRFAPKAIV